MTNKINETIETNDEQSSDELELEVKRVKSLKTSVKGGRAAALLDDGPIDCYTRGCKLASWFG